MDKGKKKRGPKTRDFPMNFDKKKWSGRLDLNQRLLGPEAKCKITYLLENRKIFPLKNCLGNKFGNILGLHCVGWCGKMQGETDNETDEAIQWEFS